MTDATTPAAPTTGAAAQAETDPQPKTITWRGLELTLPPAASPKVIRYFGEIEDGRKSIAPILNLIRVLVGDDQYDQVWDQLEADGVSMEDATDALLDDDDGLFSVAMAAYGTAPGESQASPGS